MERHIHSYILISRNLLLTSSSRTEGITARSASRLPAPRGSIRQLNVGGITSSGLKTLPIFLGGFYQMILNFCIEYRLSTFCTAGSHFARPVFHLSV